MNKQTSRQSTSILIAMALCMGLQMTGFVMLLPLFARRFESFGAGVQALAASDMAFALTSLVAAPFMGMLADRFGRRPVVLFSLAAYVLAFSGFLFAAAAWQLILLRGLAGIFTAGLIPAIMSIVADLAPETQRAQWIGIVNGGASSGWIAGPYLGGLLYDRFNYVVPFATSIALATSALLLAIFAIRETHKPQAQPGRLLLSWIPGWLNLPARSTFLLLMFVTFGVMFAWAFIGPQFTFYAYDDLNWTSARLGVVMSAYGVAFMLGEFCLGKLSDRLGRKPVLVLGLALFSVQFGGLAIFREPAWIMASFTLAGLGNALFDPALNALILDITPSDQTAGMLGLKSTAGSLGNLLGPGLMVLVAAFIRPQIVFLLASGLVGLLTLVSGIGLRQPTRTQDHSRLFKRAHALKGE